MMVVLKKWSDVLTIVSGKNQKAVEDSNGQYPIYGSGGIMGYASSYLCDAGTTIIGRKGTINSPIFVNEPFWNVDTAFGISPGNELHPKYLYYFCCFFNFKELDKSTTIPSLAKRDLLQIQMPVPSISEQDRIVSKIEELFSKLDASVAELQAAKQKLKVYRQAVLREALEGDYPCVRLKEIATAFSGYAFKSKKYSSDGRYVVVKIGNVKPFRFDFSRDLTKTSEIDDNILNKYLLKKGDCLITMTGSRGKRDYGYVAMIEDQDNYLLNQRVSALRFNDSVALPKFYEYVLSSPQYRNQFFSYETGNVGQGNVGIKALTEPTVICPTLKTQEAIIQSIEFRLSLCDSIEQSIDTSLRQAEALRQSILKQAFEGALAT